MNSTIEQMFLVQHQVMFLSVEDIDRQCPRAVHPNDTELWQTFPFDDNCLRSFFHKLTAHLRRYYPWEEWIYTILYVLISVLALVGNGVVILAVIRKPEMRTARNVLIVNLAFSNLMLAFTTVPFLWLPSIDFDFPYSNFFCKFANALPGSNIYCSTLTISVMAIDRYYSVRSIKIAGPANKSGQCFRAVLISILIWFFSLLLSFPLLIYYQVNMLYVFKDVYVVENVNLDSNKTINGNQIVLRSYGWRQCRLMTGNFVANEGNGNTVDEGQKEQQWWIVDERMIQLAMSLMQAIMLYAVPLIVISIFNVKLTRFLQMNAKQMRPRTSTLATLNGSNKLIRAESESEEQQQLQNTNGAVKQSAADRRRNKTTALLVAMAGAYAALWLPFTIVSILIDLDLLGVESGSPIMERIDQTCKLISILSICVNPFLYGFLNTNFRHEFNEIFTKCLQYAPIFRQKQICIGNANERKNLTKREAYSAIISTQDGMTTMSVLAKRKSAE